jgi:MOSC domain-containing protein YiiM
MTGRLAAVCAVHALVPDRGGDLDLTAIDKRPLDGDVEVGAGGVAGDQQVDTRHHGGPDQAVYAYAREDAAWWSAELSREVPPGLFGENLATEGIEVTGAVIGELWQVGEPGSGPLLKVRSQRTPCSTFQAWLDQPHWVKRFTEHGATGAYLAVVTPGRVRAGDPIEVVARPQHGVTVGQVFAGRRGDRKVLRRLLAEDDLAPKLRAKLTQELSVGA